MSEIVRHLTIAICLLVAFSVLIALLPKQEYE